MKNFEDENIINVKDGNFEYLKFRILDKYSDKLKHCFALRHGGVSEGLYKSLNFRLAGKDKKENVYKNLEILCNKLGIARNDVFKATQAHTDNILILDNTNKERYGFSRQNSEQIDGYVTSQKNIATLITTADCNPIIYYDPKNNIVANVHSGWKGTVKQIYLKAAKLLHDKFNTNYEDLIVCVGPSINKCCWLSQAQSLRQMFKGIWNFEDEYIKDEKDGYYSVDFPYVIKKNLISLGLKQENVVLSNICTCCNTDDFFSYRDATHKKQSDYGTEATIVELI